jgi:hypothetical protein
MAEAKEEDKPRLVVSMRVSYASRVLSQLIPQS